MFNINLIQEEEGKVKERMLKDEKCEGVRIYDLKKNFVDRRSIFKKPDVV